MMKFTYTRQERAAKKVQIAIDKMIDLKSDFEELDSADVMAIDRVLDSLNMLENRIWNKVTK